MVRRRCPPRLVLGRPNLLSARLSARLLDRLLDHLWARLRDRLEFQVQVRR
jgi:hypothetical protein